MAKVHGMATDASIVLYWHLDRRFALVSSKLYDLDICAALLHTLRMGRQAKVSRLAMAAPASEYG